MSGQNLPSLIEKALGSISLKQGVMEAKYKSPQSYAFHSISAGTLAFDICNAIYSSSDLGKTQLDKLAEKYGKSYEELCFYGGFLHDWNKLEGEDETAKEITKKLELPEEFLHGIATMAEGHLPDNLHLPLWISIKLSDMLLISDINSVKDVIYFKNSDTYKSAVNALRDGYDLELDYISSSFRLFTLVASKELLDNLFNKNAGYFPLISYPDGLVFLRKKNSQPILLSKVLDLLSKEIFSSSSQAIDEKVSEIEKCLKRKKKDEEDLFQKMNTDLKSALYDENGKIRQVNVFLPSKICKPFEDVVGNLDNKAKLEVAEKIINKYRQDIPYGILIYFTEKFSNNDKEYIRRGLGIKEKSLSYLENIKDVQMMIDKILELLKKRYSATQGEDKTLQYYIKNSFSGNIIDDLPSIKDEPKDYCVVCGMPIYSDNPVRFSQYASELKGKTEIWIPREKGLDEIDSVRDSWKVCPICIYEANLIKDRIKPPYFIITFYPGIPVSLLNIIDFDLQGIKYYVDEKDTYLEAFKNLGGQLMPYKKKVIPAYFSSKVIIRAVEVATGFPISTRLTKTDLNKLLPYAPMLSIIFLTSPVLISSDIYEIPAVHKNVISITSTFNYNFMKSLDSNLKTLYSIFAYSAKYIAMSKICKSDLDNCLNYLTEESDLYSSVDPALGVLSIGMGVGTPIENDEKFFSNFLPISGFLLKVAGMVSQMGESIRSSIFSMAHVLKDIIKSEKGVSKYDVTGFLRDGIDMFFKTTSVIRDKEDRIGISVNAAISSLENKYTLDDAHRKQAYSALQNLFDTLYEIEKEADRSLAISIANTLTNWLYIAYKLVLQGDQS